MEVAANYNFLYDLDGITWIDMAASSFPNILKVSAEA